MKKHTIEFTLYNSTRQYVNESEAAPCLCILGLKSFLDFGRRLPNTLYLTISSRKFKNSFPVLVLPYRQGEGMLRHILIDKVEVVTSLSQDYYLFDQLGSFKNNPTIHVLFERED